ncbi:MAG: hypothetical protein AB7L91_05065 [Dehalococcoidia bacterium]
MLAIALPLLVPVVMFLVWRAWLADKGEDWESRRHWESRTMAAQRYIEEQHPLTRWQIWLTRLAGLFVLVIVLATLVFGAIGR